MPNSKVLFIGLGRMGFHMSSHLSKNKKIDLYINNRTEAIEKKWLKLFSGIKYHFENDIKFDFIITCLKDDSAIDLFTKKILHIGCFNKTKIFIEHSTIYLYKIKKNNYYIRNNHFYFLNDNIKGGCEWDKN